MRVIAGVARGHRLLAPKGMRVRPTADRIKEALFSIVSSRIGDLDGLQVLDIFAGTGSLGIEALSRGASRAVFIDSHRESAQTVKMNLQQIGLQDRALVVVQDAVAALKALARNESPFQLVFLDPPYHEGHVQRVLEQLAASPLLDKESLVVAEYGKTEKIPTAFGRLQETDRRVYGDTALSFYELAAPDDAEPAPDAEDEEN